jgi:hypothetical protein
MRADDPRRGYRAGWSGSPSWVWPGLRSRLTISARIIPGRPAAERRWSLATVAEMVGAVVPAGAVGDDDASPLQELLDATGRDLQGVRSSRCSAAAVRGQLDRAVSRERAAMAEEVL